MCHEMERLKTALGNNRGYLIFSVNLMCLHLFSDEQFISWLQAIHCIMELYFSHQVCIYTISTISFTCLLTTRTCTLSRVRPSSNEEMYEWLRITSYSYLPSEKCCFVCFFPHLQLQVKIMRYISDINQSIW